MKALIKRYRDFMARCPYELDELLVSREVRSFEKLEQLSEIFGKPEPDFTYWQMLAEGQQVSLEEANTANNVLLVPRLLESKLMNRFEEVVADEFEALSLRAWLGRHPLEINRLWVRRVLAEMGIIKPSAIPQIVFRSVVLPVERETYPLDGVQLSLEEIQAEIDLMLEQFVQCAIEHYETPEDETGKIDNAVQGKAQAANELDRIQERGQLRRFLDHESPAVRVSAATYLIRTVPDRALEALRELVAEPDKDDGVGVRVARHAQQTLWAYEDGLLGEV